MGLPGNTASGSNSEMSSTLSNASQGFHVTVTNSSTRKQEELRYEHVRTIGSGSFGVVAQVRVLPAGTTMAIKKVLQDRRYKNRELQIMLSIGHRNIVALHSFFYHTEPLKPDETYLHLILEYVPETLYRVTKEYFKQRKDAGVPMIFIKLFMYQLFRCLAYLHSMNICHRDIKPQNLLVNPITGVLKLCDFGSAKILQAGEPNVSYICSRYYRAPELILGATEYSTAIDIWSCGCVMAEMLLGSPLFPGEGNADQLVEIIKILGTPNAKQIYEMNPAYDAGHTLSNIDPTPWHKVFKNREREMTSDLTSLLSGVFEYTPSKRISAIEALAHPFFNELRNPSTRLPPPSVFLPGHGERVTGNLPVLFDFTAHELSIAPQLNYLIVPEHARDFLKSRGIDITNFRPINIPRGRGSDIM